jgi:hypothetical protein
MTTAPANPAAAERPVTFQTAASLVGMGWRQLRRRCVEAGVALRWGGTERRA